MRKSQRPLAVSAAIAIGSFAACNVEPPARPQIQYSLSERTTATGGDGEPAVPLDVQANIAGALEMLFGTPDAPSYARSSEWIESGYDPNWPTYAADDGGSGEFADEELALIWADNARAFGRQLACIEAGREQDVVVPDWAPRLAEKWSGHLASSAERDADFRDEGAALFREWYPTLRESAELYRQQCLHCHGAEGGGNGPTAPFLNPKPRDYRLGVFKFTALKDKSVPRRDDLYRILDEGVTGTAMPSFRRFSKAQIHGLVDYVRLLSIRGMVERDLVITYEQDEELPAEYVLESYATMWERWLAADEHVVAFDGPVPAPTPESIARGREIYLDEKTANCVSCHGPQGRGDGVSAFSRDPQTGELQPSDVDEWGNPDVPRNLTLGVFRGGRRPIDIYRRIYAGINGTKMPGIGESKKADGSPLLSPDDLWALVHYIGSLSEQPYARLPRHDPAATAAPAGH